jgi:hypothetical protein
MQVRKLNRLLQKGGPSPDRVLRDKMYQDMPKREWAYIMKNKRELKFRRLKLHLEWKKDNKEIKLKSGILLAARML